MPFRASLCGMWRGWSHGFAERLARVADALPIGEPATPRDEDCQQPIRVSGRRFQTPFSDRIRHEARVPTMTVGAHLWDPHWTRHAAADLDHTLPWPPSYAALNR